MDIKSLLEEYDIIMDDMEASSGLNTVIEPKKEEKNESIDLTEIPANMEQATYKDIKIKKPEVDDQPIAKKLLSQCEDLDIDDIEQFPYCVEITDEVGELTYQADYDNEEAARADFNDHKYELLPNHKIELLHLVDSEGFEVLDSFKDGLDESLKEGYKDYSICREQGKDEEYYYICSNDDVYCDEDGEPYHFDTYEEAKEFLDELQMDESFNEDTEQEKIYNPTEFYIVQAFDTRDNRWFEYYRSYDKEDAYESYKDLKEMIKEGFMGGKFFKYPLLSAPGTMMHNTLDESFNEEYGEDFYHYSAYNKCKDIKKIKELIKTIRDDIKDAKEDDNKDLTSELKQDLNKAKALLKAAQDLKKNETSINEISLELAQKVNDIRNKEAVLNQEEEELQKKAEKSNKLLRKWKKSKGYEESLQESKKVGE
jgi:hypothetical protein